MSKSIQAKRLHEKDAYVVFYDGECAICQRSRAMLKKMGHKPPLYFVDIQQQAELARWPMIDPEEAQEKVTILAPDQRQITAYDAIVELLALRSSFFRFLKPILSNWLFRKIGHIFYDIFSHNRYGLARLLHLEPIDDRNPALQRA